VGADEGARNPEELAGRFESEAAGVSDRKAFDELKIRWTGRKAGIVRSLLAGIGQVPPEERKDYGQAVNRLKVAVEEGLDRMEGEIEARESAAETERARVDVTLPGRRPHLGNLHPVTLVIDEITEIFASLGYSVAEGPEVEDDYHNFTALNMPEGHPARDTQDTFFVRGPAGDQSQSGGVLRTHTSPVQIRTMLSRRPPIRVICPGRVFRNDNDLRHSPMFHQVECLAVAGTMVTAVVERRREIGLRRVVGATRGQVVAQLVVEAAMLGLVGGVLGVLGGWVAVTVLNGVTLRLGAPVFLITVRLAIGALLLPVVLAGAAGLWPALRAARLAPTDALRWT
jgi:phenylalanyl-tRNA synthetase alpha subunit